MNTMKNGKVGLLETMGDIAWNEDEDHQYYTDIHGNEEGTQERREFMRDRIEGHLDNYVETLDHAIRFLWKCPHDLDEKVLSLLSVEGKIALLRQLILHRSNGRPIPRRLDYLARFNVDSYWLVQVMRLPK